MDYAHSPTQWYILYLQTSPVRIPLHCVSADSHIKQTHCPLCRRVVLGIVHLPVSVWVWLSLSVCVCVCVCVQSVLSMSELVQMRLEASQRLAVNPLDREAQQMLAFVENKVHTHSSTVPFMNCKGHSRCVWYSGHVSSMS